MEKTKNNARKQSKLGKCLIKAPIKFLIKARDFYINSMTEYSDRIGYGTATGCPTPQVVNNNMPRSFSVNTTKSSNYDDDYRELSRAASTRGLSNRLDLDLLQRQIQQQSGKSSNCRGNCNMPRSFSVGIGRIDEDKPCEFGDEIKVKTDVFPRSRSYAVANRRTSGVIF